ncbi:MAG: carboxypeptidase regulatory-like domain-containing protein, partial [Myxococcales bacterium]|nr:carboxypeptidase regulatory-like domain-containing protein [Myxococcales bacterium]
PNQRGELVIDPPLTTFAATPVGLQATAFLTVRNAGERMATLTGIEHRGLFEVRPPPLPLDLRPGDEVLVSVRFSPLEAGWTTDLVRPIGDVVPGVLPAQVRGYGYAAGTGTGVVEGRVCAPNGTTWVVDATVSVDTAPAVSVTNEDGWFQLLGVPVGPATITVVRGSWSHTYPVDVSDGGITTLEDGSLCLQDDDVEVAVVPGEYDSIEDILDGLGIEYRRVTPNDLEREATFDELDVLFLNCGAYSWSTPELNRWVRDGGSLYASDWEAEAVAGLDPALLGRFDYTGAAGETEADVLDPSMTLAVGGSAHIAYDFDSWVQLGSDATARPLIRGTAPSLTGNTGAQALAVQQPLGSGKVLYTTFHNERQITPDMRRLLEEMILSL